MVNRGKDFEKAIRQSFEKVPQVSFDRLQDPTAGYSGISNICDFIAFKYPFQYYFECKSIRGNTLNFKSNITKKQWQGLLEKNKITGVFAGVLIWFIDYDITLFVNIDELKKLKDNGAKSLNIKDIRDKKLKYFRLKAQKKRVLFEYDGVDFFKRMPKEYTKIKGKQNAKKEWKNKEYTSNEWAD